MGSTAYFGKVWQSGDQAEASDHGLQIALVGIEVQTDKGLWMLERI